MWASCVRHLCGGCSVGTWSRPPVNLPVAVLLRFWQSKPGRIIHLGFLLGLIGELERFRLAAPSLLACLVVLETSLPYPHTPPLSELYRQQEADVEREYSIAINKHHTYTQTDIGTRAACLCLSWGAQTITPRSHPCMSKRLRKISGPKLVPRKYPSDIDYGCYTRVWLWLTHKGVARRHVARQRCPSRLGSNLTCPRRQGTRLRCPRPTRDALWCQQLHALNP